MNENELLARLGAHTCEWCDGYPVTHAETWYTEKRGRFIRYWCTKCVPMSGHYEYCPDPCAQLMGRK